MSSTTESFRSGMVVFTSRAIDALKDGTPGDQYTRDELAKKVGRNIDPGSTGYGNVNSAIRHVEKTYGKQWAWQKTERVYRCLPSKQVATGVSASVSRLHKRAGRTLVQAACANVGELTSEERRQFDLAATQAAMVRAATSTKMTKALEAKATLSPPKIEDLAGIFK